MCTTVGNTNQISFRLGIWAWALHVSGTRSSLVFMIDIHTIFDYFRERLKKYEGDVQIPSMDNYNMAAEETDYAASVDTDYRMAGNSTTRNLDKYSNDDMKT